MLSSPPPYMSDNPKDCRGGSQCLGPVDGATYPCDVGKIAPLRLRCPFSCCPLQGGRVSSSRRLSFNCCVVCAADTGARLCTGRDRAAPWPFWQQWPGVRGLFDADLWVQLCFPPPHPTCPVIRRIVGEGLSAWSRWTVPCAPVHALSQRGKHLHLCLRCPFSCCPLHGGRMGSSEL